MPDADKFSGCLLGGAVGDALGAAVEFMSLDEIRNVFGPDGIQNYAPAYGRTGAIAGNILGALYGKSSIPVEFLDQLELRELIEEMATDVVNFDYTDHYIEKYPPD